MLKNGDRLLLWRNSITNRRKGTNVKSTFLIATEFLSKDGELFFCLQPSAKYLGITRVVVVVVVVAAVLVIFDLSH